MTSLRALFALTVLTTLCVASELSAREESLTWHVIGPGGGGALFLPTISTVDPKHILVACDMTGAYISDDAGQAWRMFNLRGRVRFFVFDPHDANVIYAQSIGLW